MQPISANPANQTEQPPAYPFPKEIFEVSATSDLETTQKFGHPEWWSLCFINKNQNGCLENVGFNFFVDDKSVSKKVDEPVFVCQFKTKLRTELNTFAYFLKKSGFEFTLESDLGIIETPDFDTIKKLIDLFFSTNSFDANDKKKIDSTLLEVENALKGSYSRKSVIIHECRNKA